MHSYKFEWHDMSDYVVHFTKPSDGNSAYNNVMSILAKQVINAVNPFGIARTTAPMAETQLAVCLSEIPLHLIDRLANRRGPFGLGFTKRFLLDKGGGPIWYVEAGSSAESSIRQLINNGLLGQEAANDPIWSITPFIDSQGDYPGGSFRFEWEREWRHVGNLHFEVEDVAFLVIPEDLHQKAKGFFLQVLHEHLGPAYLCPYIDTGWTIDRVRSAFQEAV